MNVASVSADVFVEELLAILDTDARHIESTLNHLNDLRVGLIKRNEPALEQLLENIRQQQESREVIETRRQKVRCNAARLLDCRPDEVNLSRIMGRLPEILRQKVSERKARLTQLLEKLKTEYAATALLLNECTRFNRALIDSIVKSRCNGTTTYNASGVAPRPDGSGFITMQF